jgi:hypothetical protein
MQHLTPIIGPEVWTGREIAESGRWLRDFTTTQLDELDAAVRKASERGLPWTEVTRERFPLPSFAPLAADIREELENGSGMVKLRGLPVDAYSELEQRRLYFLLGSHLGTAVSQSKSGALMNDVRDEGRDVGQRYGQLPDKNGVFLSSHARALSNGALRFHTDRCDVVSLLCVRQARIGGHSQLVSTPAIHNVMLERRPDLLELLYQGYWRNRLGEEEGGQDLPYCLPVFGMRAGRFTSHYSRTYVEAAQRLPQVPKLTPAQDEALDLLAAIAQELCFEMTLAPGDIQLLNNHVIYHARGAFESDPGNGRGRLLMRIWLSVPNSRALPADHAVLWGSIAAGSVRGGIAIAAGANTAGQEVAAY